MTVWRVLRFLFDRHHYESPAMRCESALDAFISRELLNGLRFGGTGPLDVIVSPYVPPNTMYVMPRDALERLARDGFMLRPEIAFDKIVVDPSTFTKITARRGDLA